jgi:hypothetical protein
MSVLPLRQVEAGRRPGSLPGLRVRTQGLYVIGPLPGRSFLPLIEPAFSGRKVRVGKKIMELKSILVPLAIVAGWLILYGLILPALGVST